MIIKKIVCERCKKVILEKNYRPGTGLELVDNRYSLEDEPGTQIILCEKCKQSLLEWFNEGRNR